ncbi:hypothetical protein V2G26_007779 [Clonostachys chloroleuca]
MACISFDVGSVRRISLAPPPEEPPICFRCRGPSKKHITRTSNRNGNAGRPYYKCICCGQFLAFADDRGNDPSNPLCHCGSSSKMQVACREKGRKVHYVCRLGKCDFYKACHSANQDAVVTVDGDGIISLLAMLRLI